MDLKQLVQTQSKLLHQRDLEVDSLCQQAYHLIADAEASGFSDKQALKQAMQIFSQAIRQYRHAIEPYVGMAYLAILLNQETIASRCLATALYLSPDHPDALNLSQYLQGNISELESPATEGIDQKYDQFETALFKLLHFLQEHHIPCADHREETQTILKSFQEDLRQKLVWAESEIQVLEKAFDTSTLQRRLRPVENIVNNCDLALELCLEMYSAHQYIQNMLHQLRSLNENTSHTQAEAKELELLTDQIEQMESRIKDFSERGGDIEIINHHYQILTAILEQIKENLDSKP